MATSTRSGGSSTRGSPGTKPSSRPPQTSSTAGGKRPFAEATSITPTAARSARSWRSWGGGRGALPPRPAADTREGYLGAVGEVFVLRELAQSLGLDLTHAPARQAELLADR